MFLVISLLIILSSIPQVSALSHSSAVLECKKDCKEINNENMIKCSQKFDSCKQICSDKKCLKKCTEEKISCLRDIKREFADCNKYCKYAGKDIKCNGKYKLGENVAIGCEICKCDIRGLNCKKNDFCNYKNVKLSKEECSSSGGFYNQLCNGPYFDIVCSKDNFCLCEGDNDYKCPEGYTCMKEFSLSLTRKSYTIPGWKTLSGFALGDIGICAKMPDLINCGNGVCDNKVCGNCPEPETKYNCPNDCRD